MSRSTEDKKKSKKKDKDKKRKKDKEKKKDHKKSKNKPPNRDPREDQEIADFVKAVQGHKRKASGNEEENDQVQSAVNLGLPKGLVRVSETTPLERSQSFFNDLYGGDDGINPAKRQRMKREQAAQRAIDIARAVIDSRREQQQLQGGAQSATNSFSIMDRFRSTKN